MKLKEVNNGRVAMVAISGMVAQELVNGLNLIPADEVLEMGKAGALEAMEAQCTGATNEAACAKASKPPSAPPCSPRTCKKFLSQ